MIEQKMIKCEPNHPNRCMGQQGQGGNQCPFLAVEGEKYCLKHGGASHASRTEIKRASLYRLFQWQQRIDEFTAHENALSLRDELSILRLQLEQIMNMCQEPKDLMLYSSRISDLAMKIDKIANSCVKMESRSAALLDKSAALILAGQIVDTIGAAMAELPLTEEQQSEVVDRISGGIIDLVAKLAGKDIEDE